MSRINESQLRKRAFNILHQDSRGLLQFRKVALGLLKSYHSDYEIKIMLEFSDPRGQRSGPSLRATQLSPSMGGGRPLTDEWPC